MKHLKRKALLAAALSLAAAAGTVTVPGAASAQSGSRICGKMWTAIPTLETPPVAPEEKLFKLYEIPKGADDLVCMTAKAGGGSKKNGQDSPTELQKKMRHSRPVWENDVEIDRATCEEFTKEYLNNSYGLIGTNFASNTPDTHNICNMMKRSDDLFEMEAYWVLLTKEKVKEKVRLDDGREGDREVEVEKDRGWLKFGDDPAGFVPPSSPAPPPPAVGEAPCC